MPLGGQILAKVSEKTFFIGAQSVENVAIGDRDPPVQDVS